MPPDRGVSLKMRHYRGRREWISPACWGIFCFLNVLLSTTVQGETRRLEEYEHGQRGELEGREENVGTRAPTLSGLTPAVVPVGRRVLLTARGGGLRNVRVEADVALLELEVVSTRDDALMFNFVAPEELSGRTVYLTFSTSLGSVVGSVRLRDPYPQLGVYPLPVVIEEEKEESLLLSLSRGDERRYRVSVRIADSTVVTVGATEVVFEAGELTQELTLRGVGAGRTKLVFSSENLEELELTVSVAERWGGGSGTAVSRPLGVRVEKEGVSEVGRSLRVLGAGVGVRFGAEEEVTGETKRRVARSPGLGLGKGERLLQELSPGHVVRGGERELTLLGRGLSNVDGLRIVEEEGLVVERVEADAGGERVRVRMSVAEDAKTGTRRLQWLEGSEVLREVLPSASRLVVLEGMPELESVSPQQLLRGEGVELVLRGKHLREVRELKINPAQGLRVLGTLQENAAGTELRVWLEVQEYAQLGERVLQVRTLSGSSAEAGTAHNRLHVVNGPVRAIPQVQGAHVGVTREVEAVVLRIPRSARSVSLGVAKGRVLWELAPEVLSRGVAMEWVLRGQGLASVDEVELDPAEGVELEELRTEASGGAVRLRVRVSEDAGLGWRQVRVRAGGEQVSGSEKTKWVQVVEPAPELESVSPQWVARGSTVQLVLRGRYLGEVRELRLEGGSGVRTLGNAQVNSEGNEARWTLQVAADAAEGVRWVVLRTAAGSTEGRERIWNRFRVLGSGSLLERSPVQGAALGVRVEEEEPEAVERRLEAYGAALGVGKGSRLLEELGPRPVYVARGGSQEWVLRGRGLAGVDGVRLLPGEDVSVESVVAAADGRSVRVRLSAGAGAELGVRKVEWLSGTEVLRGVGFPGVDRIRVTEGSPLLESVSPQVLFGGQQVEMVLRGQRLRDVQEIGFEPAEGVQIVGDWMWNSEGTELRFQVSVDASVSGRSVRVVRVRSLSGSTAEEGSERNQFEIVEEGGGSEE